MRFFACFPACVAQLALLFSGAALAQPSPHSLPPPAPTDLAPLGTGKPATGAQPFGLHKGQDIEYQVLNTKGKITNTWRYRVLTVRTDTVALKKTKVVATTVRLKSGLYDAGNKVLAQHDLAYRYQHDTVYTDGLTEINYDGLKSFRDRLLAYSGTALAWPVHPLVGTALPAGGASIQVSSPSVAIAKVQTTISQRKVTGGPSPVTVPAGTFACYAVESQREHATIARADLILKNITRQVDYYSPAVGIVKTEYYDKSDKLTQTKVLSKY